MRVATKTNLALRVLMICANNIDRWVTTAEISRISNRSAHHAARVVNELQTMGLVNTLRGRGGGIRLAGRIDQVSIGMVVRHFESNISVAECFNPATNTCPLTMPCRLPCYLAKAMEAFFLELDKVTLDDLVRDNYDLSEMLRV